MSDTDFCVCGAVRLEHRNGDGPCIAKEHVGGPCKCRAFRPEPTPAPMFDDDSGVRSFAQFGAEDHEIIPRKAQL